MTEERTYSCNATVVGKRCDFKGTRSELTEHADTTTHKLCSCCPRSLKSSEGKVCDACCQQTRDSLRQIAATFPALDDIVEHSGYGTLAFNALVLAADGSVASPQRPDGYTHPVVSEPTAHIERPKIPGQTRNVTYWARIPHRRWQPDTGWEVCAEKVFPHQHTTVEDTTHSEFTEDRKTPDGREHVKDHWPTDPTPVIAVLAGNELDWRREFAHGPAPDLPDLEVPTMVTAATRYLLTWLSLAARTLEQFPEFAQEINALAVTLAYVTGTVDRPVVAAAKCFDCTTGTLISPYRPPLPDQGLGRRLGAKVAQGEAEQSYGLLVTPIVDVLTHRGSDVEGREMAPPTFNPTTGELDDPEPVWECSNDACAAVYDPISYRLAVSAMIQGQALTQTSAAS